MKRIFGTEDCKGHFFSCLEKGDRKGEPTKNAAVMINISSVRVSQIEKEAISCHFPFAPLCLRQCISRTENINVCKSWHMTAKRTEQNNAKSLILSGLNIFLARLSSRRSQVSQSLSKLSPDKKRGTPRTGCRSSVIL